jgi:hypothetical protein
MYKTDRVFAPSSPPPPPRPREYGTARVAGGQISPMYLLPAQCCSAHEQTNDVICLSRTAVFIGSSSALAFARVLYFVFNITLDKPEIIFSSWMYFSSGESFHTTFKRYTVIFGSFKDAAS